MSSCVIWTGCTTAGGYGRRKYKGKPELAHRVAYCEHRGLALSDIKGQVVRHECDNPACVNPLHLVLGTTSDNMLDKRERTGGHKLNRKDVDNIKHLLAQGATGSAIASLYGINKSTVSLIKNGKSWW